MLEAAGIDRWNAELSGAVLSRGGAAPWSAHRSSAPENEKERSLVYSLGREKCNFIPRSQPKPSQLSCQKEV